MSEELTPMNHRELWLQAIATGTIPEWLEPMTHQELWLNAIASGTIPEGLETMTHEELWLKAIASKEIPEGLEPMTHNELWLQAIAKGEIPESLTTMTHDELFLKQIAESGGGESYTVTVSLTNPSGTAHAGTVEISPADSSWNFTETIGSITNPTGSETVSVPSNAYGIIVSCSGSWVGYAIGYATITCTGGIAFDSFDDGYSRFTVSADGTITIDGIDWEYDY